jgi:predicted DCC family thiol-disulfide oxidoreductase YuxK
MAAKIPVLIFDGDCAFCSSSARVLRKMTRDKISVTPYQYLDLAELGLTQGQTSKAVYYATQAETFSAAKAIAKCLMDSKTPWAVAGFLMNIPVVISVAELVYAWVAKNRHRLPGGTPECSLPRPDGSNQ